MIFLLFNELLWILAQIDSSQLHAQLALHLELSLSPLLEVLSLELAELDAGPVNVVLRQVDHHLLHLALLLHHGMHHVVLRHSPLITLHDFSVGAQKVEKEQVEVVVQSDLQE